MEEQNVPKDPEVAVVKPLGSVQKISPLMAVLGILVVVLVGISAFLLYQNMQLQKQISGMKAAATPIATSYPTMGWKTYTDAKNGFLFNYPSNWQVRTDYKDFASDQQTVVTLFTADTPYIFGVSFWKNPNNLSLYEYQKYIDSKLPKDGPDVRTVLYDPNVVPVVDTEVGGIKGFYGDKFRCDPNYCATYIIPFQQKIFQIGVPQKTDKYMNDVNQILSTFKFTQ